MTNPVDLDADIKARNADLAQGIDLAAINDAVMNGVKRAVVEMNLREYFAGQAMQGLLASNAFVVEKPCGRMQERVAETAVQMADALLVAMEKDGERRRGRHAADAEPTEEVGPRQVITALLLTDFEEITRTQESIIVCWSSEMRREAFEWAFREHLHAGDNEDVGRLPCPAHVIALRELSVEAKKEPHVTPDDSRSDFARGRRPLA